MSSLTSHDILASVKTRPLRGGIPHLSIAATNPGVYPEYPAPLSGVLFLHRAHGIVPSARYDGATEAAADTLAARDRYCTLAEWASSKGACTIDPCWCSCHSARVRYDNTTAKFDAAKCACPAPGLALSTLDVLGPSSPPFPPAAALGLLLSALTTAIELPGINQWR